MAKTPLLAMNLLLLPQLQLRPLQRQMYSLRKWQLTCFVIAEMSPGNLFPGFL